MRKVFHVGINTILNLSDFLGFDQLSDFDLFVVGDIIVNDANHSYRVDFSQAGM